LAGANPNARYSDDMTPLDWSVKKNNLVISEGLLKAGADPNALPTKRLHTE